MDYQLVVLKGRSAVKTIHLGDGVTTLGRQEGCELTVRSSQISRRHCQLFEKKGLLLVKDLGSSNGTFVNRERIEEQRVLEPGDILSIGPIEFRVEKATVNTPETSKTDLASGSDAPAKPSDTAVPEPVEAPIPLDEDDVLSFVIGDDEKDAAPAPAQKTPAAAAQPEAPAQPDSKSTDESSTAASPPPKKQAPPPEPEPPGEADEAIAEFLSGMRSDDD